jgi:hypothetical protein
MMRIRRFRRIPGGHDTTVHVEKMSSCGANVTTPVT